MLGIIRAMDEEVAITKTQLAGIQVESRATIGLYKGKLEGKEVVVVRSGISKANAAIYTQILAGIYDVIGMMNMGIAGSLKAEIDIGDIVSSNDILQYGMNATGFGYEPGQIPGVEMLAFKAGEGLISLAEECYSRVSPDIHTFVGHVAIGDRFISDKEKKKWLTDTSGGYYTEMGEAAAVQTCYFNSTLFPIVRAISDKVDNGALIGHPAFEVKAIAHSVNLLTEIIRSLR